MIRNNSLGLPDKEGIGAVGGTVNGAYCSCPLLLGDWRGEDSFEAAGGSALPEESGVVPEGFGEFGEGGGALAVADVVESGDLEAVGFELADLAFDFALLAGGEHGGDLFTDGEEFGIELGMDVVVGKGGVEGGAGDGFVEGDGADFAEDAEAEEEGVVEGVAEGGVEGAEAVEEVGGPEGAGLVDGVGAEPEPAFVVGLFCGRGAGAGDVEDAGGEVGDVADDPGVIAIEVRGDSGAEFHPGFGDFMEGAGGVGVADVDVGEELAVGHGLGEAFVDGVGGAGVGFGDGGGEEGGVFADDVGGAVGAGAVDDGVVEVGVVLGEDGVDGGFEAVGVVEDGGDDGDAWGVHGWARRERVAFFGGYGDGGWKDGRG